MVKIVISDGNGNEHVLEGDAVYGCMMTRKENEDGSKGTDCESFLVGGGGIPVIQMGEPMGASVAMVIEQLAGGDKALEYATLGAAHGVIAHYGSEIFKELDQEGGDVYVGN